MRCETLIYRTRAITLRCRVNDRPLCDDGDICRTRSDIDNGGRTLVGWRNPGAKSGCETFLHHKNLADPRIVSGIDQSPLLDLGYIGYHAHDGLNSYVRAAAFGLFDEVSEHLLRPLKIAYDAAR